MFLCVWGVQLSKVNPSFSRKKTSLDFLLSWLDIILIFNCSINKNLKFSQPKSKIVHSILRGETKVPSIPANKYHLCKSLYLWVMKLTNEFWHHPFGIPTREFNSSYSKSAIVSAPGLCSQHIGPELSEFFGKDVLHMIPKISWSVNLVEYPTGITQFIYNFPDFRAVLSILGITFTLNIIDHKAARTSFQTFAIARDCCQIIRYILPHC